MASSLNTLPSELLEEISWCLAPSLASINSFAQTCRLSYSAANRVLYRLDGAQGSRALHWAARTGQLSTASLSLDNGSDINAQEDSWKFRSPLGLAAEFNQVALLNLLICRGADVNRHCEGTCRPGGKGYLDLAPLLIAARNGHPECVRRIIAAGGREDVMDLAQFDKTLVASRDVMPSGTGDYTAVLSIFLDYWITRGGPSDPSCREALRWAIGRNRIDCARLVLDRVVSPLDASTIEIAGWPLFDAAMQGHLDVVRMLVGDYNIPPDYTPLPNLETPLYWAVMCDAQPLVEYLFQAGADPSKGTDSQTPLRLVLEKGDMVTLKKFLSYCESDEARRRLASSAFVLAVSQGLRGASQLLLSYGADMETIDSDGVTALWYASTLDDATLFDVLMARGANVNPPGAVKPLHEASSRGTKAPRVQKLIEAGADVDAKDTDGLTPLMYACKAGHLGDARVVKLLLDAGADPRATDNVSYCAVSYAMAAGRPDFVRMVLAKGGHVNLGVDGREELYLPSAVRSGAFEFVKLLVEECGADITVKDAGGESILRRAIYEEDVQIVKFLLDAGHEIAEGDLDVARERGCTQIRDILQRKATARLN
ncbi:ankyrin repeat-containing domain protein [Emericellopsis atlantica]|uniref:Ankyrin repeat-containing domain protein n=1 Tax=Emericellopsis atlantica TaxID=2614577 RepID=A0A9P7ZPH6_9HYPO|nr:ankyrin repeat-containing domain protein [Emericellopsis atlantica]KAG9255716.1 ankyrin repeat-containing domain protein [Emericellopsis atlantica]